MYFFEKNEAFRNHIICIHDNGEEFTYGQLWDKLYYALYDTQRRQ